MIRLNITVEGKTEEAFVKRVLTEHLACYKVYASVRRVQTGNYVKAKNDIQRWVKEDGGKDARFSTMFDLYRLPKDFPRYDEIEGFPDPYQRIKILGKIFGMSDLFLLKISWKCRKPILPLNLLMMVRKHLLQNGLSGRFRRMKI